MNYFETSCKTGENIDELLEQIASDLVRQHDAKMVRRKTRCSMGIPGFISARVAPTGAREFRLQLSIGLNSSDRSAREHAGFHPLVEKQSADVFHAALRADRQTQRLFVASSVDLLQPEEKHGYARLRTILVRDVGVYFCT